VAWLESDDSPRFSEQRSWTYLQNRTACLSMQSGVCWVVDQFRQWMLRTTGIVIDFAGFAYSRMLISPT